MPHGMTSGISTIYIFPVNNLQNTHHFQGLTMIYPLVGFPMEYASAKALRLLGAHDNKNSTPPPLGYRGGFR
jgi:hypothetical protein